MNAPAHDFRVDDAHAALTAAFAHLAEQVGGARSPQEVPVPPPLVFLAEAFGLTRFERDLLLLAVGAELDARLAGALRQASGSARVSFRTAGAVLDGAHLSCLAPARPLRRWRLLEPETGAGLLDAPLTPDERILHFLLGQQSLDPRIERMGAPLAQAPPLAERQRAAAARLAELLATGHAPLVALHGGDPADRRAIAAAAAARLGLSGWRLDLDAACDDPAARAGLSRLVERETALTAFLAVCEGRSQGALDFMDGLAAPALVLLPSGEAAPDRVSAVVEAPSLAFEDRRALWSPLAASGPAEAEAWDRLAYDFPLSATEIAAVVREADEGQVEPVDRDALVADLRAACRRRAARPVGRFVERLPISATWDDLVLAEGPLASLRAIAAQVRRQAEVYRAWGFGRAGARGLGVTALFAGPSGTGKTMAAEVLAGELDLECLRIDLSQVVSKYIGETEKNLDQVFAAGERGGALLLFDEAEALFGKRSEVKDSHDRYANIEVGYLLQKMESYGGPAVLTSNIRSGIDEAFLRRLRFVVHFPFPDQALRAQLWRQAFPAAAPVKALDFEGLARLGLSGGNIRTVALNAAFLAAEDGQAIGMDHLHRAVQAEMVKLQRPAQGGLGGEAGR